MSWRSVQRESYVLTMSRSIMPRVAARCRAPLGRGASSPSSGPGTRSGCGRRQGGGGRKPARPGRPAGRRRTGRPARWRSGRASAPAGPGTCRGSRPAARCGCRTRPRRPVGQRLPVVDRLRRPQAAGRQPSEATRPQTSASRAEVCPIRWPAASRTIPIRWWCSASTRGGRWPPR